jgi:hypothetical protein
MKNKLYKLIIFSLIFGAAQFKAFAQFQCGTTEATKKLHEKYPELIAAEAAYDAQIAEIIRNKTPEDRDGSQVYIIPIVFHILHTNGVENIPDANIYDQVRILNEDFRKLNSDTATVYSAFQSRIADCRIEIRLAQKDPNGNCTNGIDRIYSYKTNLANDDSKLNQWPRDKYLNIWVIKTMENPGTAGYAYKPASAAGFLTPYDGIIIRYDYIGSLSPASSYNSRALTHEIGHYLNLSHPWGNNNDPNIGCGDDGVTDTPPTKGRTACATTIDKFIHECSNRALTKQVYNFGNVTTTSGMVDPTPVDSTENVLLSSFKAEGVSANSAADGRFEFSGWGTGAANGATYNSTATFNTLTGTYSNTKYYEFVISPKNLDSSMTITKISFNVNRSADGPRTWVMRTGSYNAGGTPIGFGSNLVPKISPANTNFYIGGITSFPNVVVMKYDSTSSQVGLTFELTGANYTRITPIIFRIYAYNAEDANGSFGVDSVRITGTNGVIENFENYMDYSYCSKMFTNGQKDFMRTALESQVAQRNSLWSPANMLFTGVENPVPCKAHPEFYANKTRICAGTGTGSATNKVRFTKNVLYATPDSVRWYFEGGTPATSNLMTPVDVVYLTPGLFKVTLVAYNSAGVDSVVKNSFIRVDDTWGTPLTSTGPDNGSYTETWENPEKFFWDWQVINPDDDNHTWKFHNTAGYTGSKCVYMDAYNYFNFAVDDLLSPPFDLAFTHDNVFSFKCAAASRGTTTAEINDELKVYSSIDCGATWQLRGTFKDSTLINNGFQPAYWTPNLSSTWTQRFISLPPAVCVGNVRFKFEYNSGESNNNVYIDDINISGGVGISENSLAASSLSIYPNPANQTSTIAYHLDKKANVKIEVVDVLGKTIFSQTNSNQLEGDYSVLISKQSLHMINGIYFVKFSVDNEMTTKKLIITE